ncbi:prolyl oligopeptidase family serine peptidase [Parasediminibacterium sp. JCM 36343]|uniref:prolyl oligopeptidase family serine peptidase n=1 Tax=Parasediminibacterium sp. JCM 36343 TaxID=3374279 RepID=UPI00397BE461
MTTRALILLALSYAFAPCFGQPFVYPTAKKDTVTNNYFGTVVADPYRWMENAASEETRAWVAEENTLSRNYLDKLVKKFPVKDQMDLNSHFTNGKIQKSGSYYFKRMRDYITNRSQLYIQRSYKEIPALILDPFEYKENEKEIVSLEDFAVSTDDKYLAFALARNGSDWREIRVKTIYTLKDEPDIIKWVKFSSIKWVEDGFYYCRYPESTKGEAFTEQLLNQAVYYHKLGTPQSEDKMIYSDPENPKMLLHIDIVGNNHYLLIYRTNLFNPAQPNEIWQIDIKNQKDAKPSLLVSSAYPYSIIGEYNGQFLASTLENAPRGKVVLLNPDSVNSSKPFIRQYKNVLKKTSIVGNKVVCLYLTDIEWSSVTFDSSGIPVNKITFPLGTTVSGFDGDSKSNTTFFGYASCLHPYVAYQYDVDKLKTTLLEQTVTAYDAHELEVKKVFVTSKDGEQIPMVIACKKGMKKDGKTPTLLYGYGGFGISTTGSFDIGFVNFVLNGGIVALPCIRGGGEYGEEWHKKGQRLNKQNSFDDFIAAAAYLEDSGYTQKGKLAIMGGSNGGLVVGAVITQRPDICKVAISEVGVFDMLRYHLFTNGNLVSSEYGTSKNPIEFPYIFKYSPLHNVKDDAGYPATLVITGDHDDRVVPMHSYKFVAALQEKNKTGNPILLVTSSNTGHHSASGGDVQSYIYSFIYEQLGVKPRSLY